MKLRTRQGEANTAARRWSTESAVPDAAERRRIGRELRALGKAPAPGDVDRVIGNDYWTTRTCSECRVRGVPMAEVGDMDNDFDGAYLCRECLARALALLDGEPAP